MTFSVICPMLQAPGWIKQEECVLITRLTCQLSYSHVHPIWVAILADCSSDCTFSVSLQILKIFQSCEEETDTYIFLSTQFKRETRNNREVFPLYDQVTGITELTPIYVRLLCRPLISLAHLAQYLISKSDKAHRNNN